MATLEQLKTHITKAKGQTAEAKKKAGDNKDDADVRAAKKKQKRLARKAGKIVYMEKMKADKKKKSKNGDAG